MPAKDIDLQHTMARLMQIAVEQGDAGVAALERLVALQERAQQKTAQAAHAAALAAFQSVAPVVAYNRRGAHGAQYATLDHILSTLREPLAANGLAVTFDSAELDDGRMQIACIVHHALGHSERSTFTVSRERASNRMNDTQRDGSAMSYGRRYALSLALGITTGEVDDDGERAARRADPVTDKQAADLRALMDECGMAYSDPTFLAWAGVETVADLPSTRYAEAVRLLERKRARGAADAHASR